MKLRRPDVIDHLATAGISVVEAKTLDRLQSSRTRLPASPPSPNSWPNPWELGRYWAL